MRRKQRRQLILVTTVLVVFVVVLAVWVGNPTDGHETALGVTSSPSTTAGPTLLANGPLPTSSAPPVGSGTAAAPEGAALPPVSGIQVYGPGIHHVVLTVTSNSTIAEVGWGFRNGRNGGKRYAVGNRFELSEDVEGGAPLAIVGGQVAYYGSELTCSISVDGTVRNTETVHGAFHVAVCIA